MQRPVVMPVMVETTEESFALGGPPPCNSDIIRIYEDPNIIPIIPYSHYYWVGGPPNICQVPDRDPYVEAKRIDMEASPAWIR